MTNALQPTADFTWDPIARPPIAGLRPWRTNSYRLEPEMLGDKFVVHNYGHGGAGITMSWGCAQEVLDFISARGLPPNTDVAVIGCGVMGMTVASVLASARFQVTIYAKDFPPHTTSNVAGGSGRRLLWSTITTSNSIGYCGEHSRPTNPRVRHTAYRPA